MNDEKGEIRWLGDMQRIRLEPGDVFVLQCDRPVSVEQRQRLQSLWKSTMGEAKLMIIDAGMKLGVVAEPK